MQARWWLTRLLAHKHPHVRCNVPFGNDGGEDLAVASTLGCSTLACGTPSTLEVCIPTTDVLAPNAAITSPLEVCTLAPSCTATTDVPSQQAPPPVDQQKELPPLQDNPRPYFTRHNRQCHPPWYNSRRTANDPTDFCCPDGFVIDEVKEPRQQQQAALPRPSQRKEPPPRPDKTPRLYTRASICSAARHSRSTTPLESTAAARGGCAEA